MQGPKDIALPDYVPSYGTLDRLVDTTQNYASNAVSENTLKAYARDWVHFAR